MENILVNQWLHIAHIEKGKDVTERTARRHIAGKKSRLEKQDTESNWLYIK